jgi:NifB/MoaA-like Fe-S oxidoreductase
MHEQLRYHYLHSVSTFNVLPVTSRCLFSCIFCSHRQNPPGVEAFTAPDLTPSMIDELFIFLDPAKKIVVGESATRFLEGEPFCNKALPDILEKLRRRFPSTPIHIATNGTLLSKKTVQKISRLMPLELSVSVNIIDSVLRLKILGETKKTDVLQALSRLSESGIPYSTSLVALPGLTGWEALEEAVTALSKTGSEVIKLYRCSITDYAEPGMAVYAGEAESLAGFCSVMKERVKTPILLEPPAPSDLKAVTEGAVRGSPGDRAGIMAGDEMLMIDGAVPRSRVDAFRILSSIKGSARLVVRQAGQVKDLRLSLQKGERPGITFLYDIDPDCIYALKKAAMRSAGPLVMTSELALPLIKASLASERLDVPAVMVKNRFFGGTIACAGLMTVVDIIRAIPEDGRFREILLPSAPFDGHGRDLTGSSWLDIEEHTGLKVSVI